MLSVVLIIPADLRDKADQLAELMGWGPNSYSVPLSADGSEPATYYGLHAWVTEDFQTLIETGAYPSQLADAGISQDDYDAMMAVLISSFWADYAGHFATVCRERGLAITEGK